MAAFDAPVASRMMCRAERIVPMPIEIARAGTRDARPPNSAAFERRELGLSATTLVRAASAGPAR
jgi:hypothetical protein